MPSATEPPAREDPVSPGSGRRIATNTLWNALGSALPLGLGLVTVPVLVRSLTVEQFGVVALGWVVLGYLGLADLGLGKAVTAHLSSAISTRDRSRARRIYNTAVALSGALGVVAAVITVASADIVAGLLNAPPAVLREVSFSLTAVAFVLPLVTVSSVARGALEAAHMFRLLNLVQIPASSAVQLAPMLAVLLVDTSAVAAVIGLALARAAGSVCFLMCARRAIPSDQGSITDATPILRPLLGFGGWLTVSNVVGPIMGYVDRFVIGATVSIGAVAQYAAPAEVLSRLSIIPHSLARTLFPIFATPGAAKSSSRLYLRAVRDMLFLLNPIVVTVVFFASPILTLMFGADYSVDSTIVMQVLAPAMLLNAVAQIPLSISQALGRPDLPAKLYLVQVPLYLVVLALAVPEWGILGAAVVWSLRSIADALLQNWVAVRLLGGDLRETVSTLALPAGACLTWTGLAGLASMLDSSVALQFAILSFLLAGSVPPAARAVWSWRRIATA